MARGSVKKRGKTWTYVIPIGKYENGKTKYKWVGGFKKQSDAEKALNREMGHINKYGYIEESGMTVKEYMKQWFDAYKVNLKPSTARGYRVNIENHIIPQIGQLKLSILQRGHVQNMYDDLLSSGLSGTTVIYIHRVLRKALKKAVGVYIRMNPADDLELPKKSEYKAQVLDEGQVKRLLKMSKETDIYIPILLAVGVGLRRGEVLGLMWEDIDFDQNIIHIRRNAVTVDKVVQVGTPKSKTSRRSILVSSKKILILKDHMKKHPGAQYVVTGADGKIYSSSILNDRFKELLQDAGLPNIRFHDLRHTFATIGLRKGIHPKVMSGILGHSTIGITMNLYSHLDISMQESAVSILDDEI